MIRPVALFLALVFAYTPIALMAEPWITGYAYSKESDQLLYHEVHYRSSLESSVSNRVDYIAPDQEVIVAKTLDFSESLLAPAIEQRDYRNATAIFTRYTSTGFEVGYKNNDTALRVNSLNRSESLVVDAGFDSFVRQHWDTLIEGDTVRAQFLVPARLDTVNIGIRATQQTHCRTQSDQALCLIVRPAGLLRLLGWFVDPLYLAYERDSKRLLQYSGISNLLDDNGAPQDVIIRYEYH